MAKGPRSNFEIWGGGGAETFVTRSLGGGGGAQDTFILTLGNLKNNWGTHVAPLLGSPCGPQGEDVEASN